jgi:uncharacterized protein involved in outer membrane biogenesis
MLLILIAAVPILFVIVVLLYLNFADLSGWRDTVAELASDAIGRELRIDGEFQPEIGWTTRIFATNITLANADWSDDPHMVTVDRLAGEIDLLSILFGPITIRDVEIAGARVVFELNSESRFNWNLGDGEPGDDVGGDVELVIGHALVSNLQLLYARPQEKSLEATLSSFEFTDDGTGMLEIGLAGTVEGLPVKIAGRLGTFIGLINAASVENDFAGHLGNIEFKSAGRIAELAALGGADLTARVHGPDLNEIADAFDLPVLPSGAFEIDLGVRPAAGGSYLELDASAGDITTQISGTVDSLIDPGVLDVTVEASGPDVTVIGAMGSVEGLPSDPFEVSGRVRWEGYPVTCDKVEVRVGTNTLSANGVVGEPPLMLGTDFSFDGGGPDISTIAALAGIRLPQDSFSVAGRLVRLEEGIGVQGVEARVGRTTFEVDGTVGDPPEYSGTALTVKGNGPNLAHFQDLAGTALPAEPFEIEGRLVEGDGAISLEAVRARLGDNTLEVGGELETEAGFAGTDLRLKAAGPDAAKLAEMAEISDVPAEAFSVEGRLRVLEKGYRLNDVLATLGSLAVKANGYVGPSPTLTGSDLEIEVEDSDLSHPASFAGVTGLPRDPFSIEARVRVEESGYRMDGLHAVIGDIEAQIDGFVGPPPELDGTKLAITARGSRIAALGPYLDLPDLPDAPFSVAGGVRVVGGSYLLDQIVAEVEENRATATGTVSPSENLAGTDLEFEFDGPDLREIGRLMAGFVDLPELPAEPYTLSGQVVVDASGYELRDVEGSLAEAVAKVAGRLGSPPELLDTDLTIEIDGPNASLMTSLLGATVPMAPFELSGRIERHARGYQFHKITGRLGEYRAAIDGSLGELPKLIGTDLDVQASGPGTSLIGELAGVPDFPDRPFAFQGGFSGTPEKFEARDFSLRFGPSDLAGSFTVDITGKPDIRARLTSNTVDLGRFHKSLQEEETESEVAADPDAAAERKLVFSDEPLDLATLEKVDGDISLRISNLVLTAMKFHDLEVDLELNDGRLEIGRLAATGQNQGRLDGNLILEPVAGGHRLGAEVSMRQIRLDIPGSKTDRMEQPPIDIDIDLDGFGATPHELASSANGAVQLVIGKGVMDSRALDLVTADILLTLLNAFNPFAKQDVATELQCGVALLSFDGGVARLEPMAFQSDKMTMLGKGRIDLGTEKLNFEWVTKPRKGVGISASMITNPYIRLGGTLSNPSVQLKEAEAVVSTGAAVATMGLSLVAKGMFDRITAEKKVCKHALEEIAVRTADRQ